MYWVNVDEKMALEILRQAEKKIEATMEIYTASDRRAVILSGIFSSTAVAIFAGFALRSTSQFTELTLVMAGLTTGVAYILAAAICAYSSRPGTLYIPGSDPKNWLPLARHDYVKVVGARAEFLQEHIDENLETLRRNGQISRIGLFMGIAAPILGLVAWITAKLIL